MIQGDQPWLGFLVSAICNATLLAFMLPLASVAGLQAVLITSIIFLPFSIFGHILFGLPVYLLLRRYKWINIVVILFSGALCGMVGAGVLILTSIGDFDWIIYMSAASGISAVLGFPFLRTSRSE